MNDDLLSHIKSICQSTEHPFSALVGFIEGYKCFDERCLTRDFTNYVARYFGEKVPTGPKSWIYFLNKNTKSESEAFEEFFRLYKIYLNENNQGHNPKTKLI